ncbi:MAG: hypothetical protein ACOCRK_03160 [bacterium]
MPKNDNVFETTEIFSETEWNNDSNNKNLSARLLNNNGFIIFFQEQNPKGKGRTYWQNQGNFWCRKDDMPVLAKMVDLVITDIKNNDYSKERFMKGSKSDFYILAKESNGTLYVAAKLVPKDENGRQQEEDSIMIKFTTEKVLDGIPKALVRLEAFRDAIVNTYNRTSTSYDSHFKKYFDAVNRNRNEDNNNSTSSNNSDDTGDIENDDDYPF